MSLAGGALQFVNERLTANLKDDVKGLFVSGAIPMNVPGLNVVPVISGNSIRIGNVTLAAQAAFFTVDPAAASAAPFGLSGTFGVKGIDANFDPPMPFQANDMTLLTSAVHIDELSLTVSLVKAHPAIRGFELTGSTFGMTKKDSTDSPIISGTLTAPISIRLAEADLPYTAPISMYNLNVQDAKVAIKDAIYQGTDGSKAVLPVIAFDLTQLSDDTIVAGFETTSGTYHALLASPDAGTIDANIQRIKLAVNGPRKPLKGTLDLSLGAIDVGGTIAWKPLLDCCGDIGDANAANPNFIAPLQISASIPGLVGSLAINGDIVTGSLTSKGTSEVTAKYLGPAIYASWDHDWLLQEEVDWSSDYPCIGTITDPVRTCHASGVLLPNIEGSLRWHFTLVTALLTAQVTDFGLIPKTEDKSFTCTPDPVLCPGGTMTRQVSTGVTQCAGHLSPFNPSWGLTLFTIYPDIINASGDAAKLFNGLIGGIIGEGQSITTSGLTLAANSVYAVAPLWKCS